MSISAISGLINVANTALSAVSAAKGASDFATLLAGELQNLLGFAQDEKANPEIIKNTLSDILDRAKNPASGIDPAFIAALMGNANIQPSIINRGSSISVLPEESLKNLKGQMDTALFGRENPIQTTGLGNKIQQASNFSVADEKTALLRGNNDGAANIAAGKTEGDTPNTFSSLLNTQPSIGNQVRPNVEIGTYQATVNTPFNQAAWPSQFNEKIVWMAKNEMQTAQINIVPQQLGPVQITLNLQGDQATLAFISPHAEVRQAIESAMPLLKEMLAASGINLGQANVGAQTNSQHAQNNAFNAPHANPSSNENVILSAHEQTGIIDIGSPRQKGQGLVDLFA